MFKKGDLIEITTSEDPRLTKLGIFIADVADDVHYSHEILPLYWVYIQGMGKYKIAGSDMQLARKRSQ